MYIYVYIYASLTFYTCTACHSWVRTNFPRAIRKQENTYCNVFLLYVLREGKIFYCDKNKEIGNMKINWHVDIWNFQKIGAIQYVKKWTKRCHKSDTIIQQRYLFLLNAMQIKGVPSSAQDNFLGCCEERVNHGKYSYK